MGLGDAFREFAQRVLAAARRGGLSRTEHKKLGHLLTRTGKRNTILAKGILTALDTGGATRADIARFGGLLEKANHRILDENPPFTPRESEELTAIFRRAYISRKTTGWFSSHLDELLAQEISGSIKGEGRLGVPKKTEQEERRKLKA